ncbi:MAG: hypothetical protein M0040_02915 [Actinomycetota bacterium]|jgi:hypothetical protein|nr:hypothetical protein [Actinomycetota bacterium]
MTTGMRKYFTWRNIALHVLVAVLVPVFLWLGDWQYHAAESGNTLSWVYTFEWPAFALYALYVWWQLIHDRSTALDKLRAARERAAAAASGVPIEEVPGWALDRRLSKALTRASLGKPDAPALASGAVAQAIASSSEPGGGAAGIRRDDPTPIGAAPDVGGGDAVAVPVAGREPVLVGDNGPDIVDADVLDVTVEVDEELDAYNRYLAELSRSDPPKRW